MRLDRRNFLQFAAGAAGGFLLTPINWKLMDDVAIWTQNWSWVPVPEDGARAYAATTCQICGGGCGVRVRLVSGSKSGQRAVKIEGQPNSPLNRGGLCAWGVAGLQYMYLEENRVPGPMKRDPKISAWTRISWDEALDILAARLKELKASPGKVALLNGRKRSTVNRALRQFLFAYGSPNYLELADGGDAQEMASRMVFGQPVRYGYDLERAEVILSFGAALLEGWGSPVRLLRAFELWRSREGGTTVIQVEPRASVSSAKADVWLPARPGSEADLALGLAQVLVAQELISPEARQAQGFEALRTWLNQNYSPAMTAKATGLRQDQIVETARKFAQAKKAVALSGLGQGRRMEPLQLAWAVLVLNCLKGNLGQPGGLFLTPDLPGPELPQVGRPAGRRADGLQAGPVSLPRLVEAEDKPNLLMLYQANPVFSGPEPAAFSRYLDEVPFKVSFSSFWDETTRAADLVLPDQAYLEGWGDVETPLGLPYQSLGLSRPLLKPVYETRATGDVFLELAQRLGGGVAEALPYKTYEAMIHNRLGVLQGLGQGRSGQEAPPAPDKVLAAGPGKGFGSAEEALAAVSASGVWYSVPAGRPQGGLNLAPAKAKPGRWPEELKGDEAGYPLLLVAFESFRVASGFYANPPFVTKLLDDDFLLRRDVFASLHPSTAAQAGLSEGDEALLKTPAGQGRVRVHVTEGAMPGAVFLPLGLGHQAFDPTLKDRGVNAAALVPALEDPWSGQPIEYLARVKLAKA